MIVVPMAEEWETEVKRSDPEPECRGWQGNGGNKNKCCNCEVSAELSHDPAPAKISATKTHTAICCSARESRFRDLVNQELGCPLWVKSGHSPTFGRCPLYPQKRILELSREMSALCRYCCKSRFGSLIKKF